MTCFFSNKSYRMDNCLFCIINDMFSLTTTFGDSGSTPYDIPLGHTITAPARSSQIPGAAVREEEE